MSAKRTNIEIDIQKLNQAKKISGMQTTRETVDFALGRLVGSARALKQAVRLKGKVRFAKGYDYKEGR